jgi:hypothetical protein
MIRKTIRTYGLYVLGLVICISVGTACNVSNTQSPNKPGTFARTIYLTYQGKKVNARPQAMAPDGNGGAVITGQFLSGNQTNIFVARIDNEGNLMWQKSFGGKGNDVGWDVIRTDNNEFVVCGTYGNYLYLLRIDSKGRVVWQHKYQRFHEAATDSTLEQGSNDAGITVVQGRNGGFYAAGETTVFTPPGYYAASVSGPSLLHVNSEGKRLWFKQYRTPAPGFTNGIVQGPKENLIMVGPYNGIPSGIFSTTKKGAVRKSFLKLDFVYNSIRLLKNGNFVIGGNGEALHRITVSEVSASGGSAIWSNEYGHGFLYDIVATRNGDIVAVGSLLGKKVRHQAYFFKLDANGNVLWKRTPDFAGETVLYGVEQGKNGGFLMAGIIKQKYHKNRLLIIRADSQGHIRHIGKDLKPSMGQ